MRRTTIRLGVAAVTFAVGLMAASLSQVLPGLKAIFDEPTVEAPPMPPPVQEPEVYPEATTTDDFNEFWSEFKAAVARDDKEKLYALVCRNEFSWEPLGVRLSYKGSTETPSYYRVIRSYDDFAQNYSKIFRPFVKRAILSRRPSKDVGGGAYVVQWTEGKGREGAFYTLMFANVEGYGYKFTGALMGPAY